MDLNWTHFSRHLISLTRSAKGIWQLSGNTSQAMPGVLTIQQPLTILSLTGLSFPPTTEEHDQKLPFTLGKCPVSSTNQSSPIKAGGKYCWQPNSAEPRSEDAEDKKTPRAPRKHVFHLFQLRCPCPCCPLLLVVLSNSNPGSKADQQEVAFSGTVSSSPLVIFTYPTSCQVKSAQWWVCHPSQVSHL